MWIKIKEELFNLDFVRNITKEENSLIFFYKMEMDQFEDYAKIYFDSKEEIDKIFKKIEKILGIE